MDWKSSLESLRAAMPVDEANNAVETAHQENGDTTPSPKDSLRVLLDRKGRKGKDATIVEGFSCQDEEVARIASALKQKLGTGGSARGGEILIQGDKRREVAAQLSDMGFNCKII